MKKSVMKRWVKALRSGKYKQGKDYLKGDNNFCCLGVLCDISNRSQWVVNKYLNEERVLPSEVIKWSGMKSCNGDIFTKRLCTSLSLLNDDGRSFKQIANIIEKNYEVL